jgi:hypothetical protein
MRILQISTHTTLLPGHGGQIRSNRIAHNVERAGHTVRRLAVGYRPSDHVDDRREPHIDIATSRYCKHRHHIRDFGTSWGHFTDYGTLFAVRECPDTKKLVFNEITAAAPELIMLEHPWLWPIVDAYCLQTGKKIPVIYNSQNVEGQLKRDIAANEGLNVPESILAGIETLERDCVLNSVTTTTCTDSDRNAFLALGGRSVVTVPNGTDPPQRDHLLNSLPLAIPKDASYALVVGSGHPPNISGFMNLMASSLPRLRSNQRFVVVGGAGDYIANELKASGREILTEGRFVNLGKVSNLVLDAAIANASVVAVPIQYGGGSNLKTAEALLSGRRVVATAHSLRGFPEVQNSKNLRIAEDKHFGETVLEELGKPFRINYDDAPVQFLWENTTKPIIETIAGVESAMRG